MTTAPKKVAILGGGVTGLTTAIVLQMHGINTRIYTQCRLDQIHPTDAKRRPPELASIHAAASVLPHSAKATGMTEIMRISQLVFHRLAFCGHFGVRQQRHYELYEKEPSLPDYAAAVTDFTLLNKDGTAFLEEAYKGNIPVRAGAKGVWGWHFNAFFCEVPTYIQSLYNLYDVAGGQVKEIAQVKSVDEFRKAASAFEPDALVICAGFGSPSILGTGKLTEVPVTRGHMTRVHLHQVPHDKRDLYFSYNYSPSYENYSDSIEKDVYKQQFTDEGTSVSDVYFYPRSDGWLLGGSRQAGVANLETGEWRPASKECSGMSREEYENQRHYFKQSDQWVERIPKRIWDLNRELVMKVTKVDINKYPSSSYIGYRFLTDPIFNGKDNEASK